MNNVLIDHPVRVAVGLSRGLVRDSMLEMLKRDGFDVVGVTDDMAALMAIVSSGRPDVCLVSTRVLGDGFMPTIALDGPGAATLQRLRRYVKEAGRDPATFGIDVRVHLGGSSRATTTTPKPTAQLIKEVREWSALGVSHITFNTRWASLNTLSDHIQALRKIKQAIDQALPASG